MRGALHIIAPKQGFEQRTALGDRVKPQTPRWNTIAKEDSR
jgi:hypothetical protein